MENKFPDVINTVLSTFDNNSFLNFDFRSILYSIIVSMTPTTISSVVEQKDILTPLVSL
jgi:hypothetical protein